MRRLHTTPGVGRVSQKSLLGTANFAPLEEHLTYWPVSVFPLTSPSSCLPGTHSLIRKASKEVASAPHRGKSLAEMDGVL